MPAYYGGAEWRSSGRPIPPLFLLDQLRQQRRLNQRPLDGIAAQLIVLSRTLARISVPTKISSSTPSRGLTLPMRPRNHTHLDAEVYDIHSEFWPSQGLVTLSGQFQSLGGSDDFHFSSSSSLILLILSLSCRWRSTSLNPSSSAPHG